MHGQPAYIHDAFISTGDDLLAFHANDTLVERMTFGRCVGAWSTRPLDGAWVVHA